MQVSVKTLVPALLVSLALGGCKSVGNLGNFGNFGKDDSPVAGSETNTDYVDTTAVEHGYVALEGLTSKKRMNLILKYLEEGKATEARAELVKYMETKKSDRAKRLLKQIDTPSGQYYPAKNFTVTMKKGESLSTLSRDYLGDAYSFYGLAKYNGIAVPSKINAGQRIKIPATKSSLKHKAKLIAANQAQPKPVVSTVVEEPTDATASKIVEQAVEQKASMEQEVVTPPETAKVIEKVLSPREKMNNALGNGDYVNAVKGYEEMRSKEGVSTSEERKSISMYNKAAKQLETSNPKQASLYSYEAGKTQIKFGDREGAIVPLQKAVNLNSGNSKAKSTLAPIKQEYVDYYHSEASIAYRKQELEKAIELWNKVLKLDPDHSAAKAYVAQATELKTRLDKLQ
jgi:tetratricopeptide (TPR) repeat protein